MNPSFSLRATPHFQRLAEALTRRYPEFADIYKAALRILSGDPYNRSRAHTIKKLADVPKDEGQYRLRLRRFRFRYDIYRNEVVLRYCGLRREDTYRE